MRLLLSFICLSIITLYSGCGKSSPAPATAEGKWTYTTSDGKIKVAFELVKTASGSMDIKNPASITVNGTLGVAAAQISGVNLPDIASIIINANDAALTYPYSITFTSCKFLSDVNRMDVSSGSYTYPWGTNNPITAISILRP